MDRQYKITLTELRASTQNGKRYAKVRAIANGQDSYKSIFTQKARESVINQIMQNGVGSRLLHADAVLNNINVYLESRVSKATPEELETINKLKGQMPMIRPPIGKPVDAKFLDDNTIEVLIEEIEDVKALGDQEKQYHEAAWNMVMTGAVKGVSTVFHSVKSFAKDGKLFIDDLILTGLDFVDKAAHPQTQVMEVFVRAAQDSIELDTPSEVRASEPKMTEIDSEKIEKAVQAEVDKKLNEEKLKAEALAKVEAKEKEIQAKIQALEMEKAELSKQNTELVEIAKEAVEKLKVTRINPYANAVAQTVSNVHSDLSNRPLSELFKLKDEATGLKK